MPDILFSFRDKLKMLSKIKHFDDILILLIAFITFIGWTLGTLTNIPLMLGLDLLIIIAVVLILVFNDLKYLIPVIIYLIYNMANEVDSGASIPIDLIIGVIIFGAAIIYHTIKNKIDLRGIYDYKFFRWHKN